MPRKTRKQPPKTPEAGVLSDAIDGSGITMAAIADHMGVSPSMVSQWASGHRPVSAAQATPLAQFLDLQPGQISAEYRRVAVPTPTSAGALAVRDHPYSESAQLEQMRSQIEALNLAVGILASATTRHRPIEAREAAAALKKRVPSKKRDHGLLQELIAMLEQAKP